MLFLLLFVHFYLKSVFFRPMADVLAKRRAATDGVRESADALRAKAGEQMKSIEGQFAAGARNDLSGAGRGSAGLDR